MFKIKRNTLMLATALLMLGACSDKEDDNNVIIPEPEQNLVPAPRITADMAKKNNNTRAVWEDNPNYALQGEGGGEVYRWVVGDQVLVEFSNTDGVTRIPYKVATVNTQYRNRCTFEPVDANAEIPTGTHTVTGYSSATAWETLLKSGEEGIYTLDSPTQTANNNSDHLHNHQLMKSDLLENVEIADGAETFSLTFNQLASVMRFVVTNDREDIPGATIQYIQVRTDKAIFDSKLNYDGSSLESAEKDDSCLLIANYLPFDSNNQFQGFVAMRGYEPNANPTQLTLAVGLRHEGGNHELTKTIKNTDGVGLPNGFVIGTSYSFNISLKNFTEKVKILTNTAAGDIYRTPERIDSNLTLDGTLAVRGPINNDDLTTIATRMKDTTKPAIKKLDLSGATNLETINGYTFQDCTSLETIELPEGVTTINQSAFKGCTSLSTVTLPQTLETINGSVFYECKSLKSIVIPTNVKTLGTYVFYGCELLETVDFQTTKLAAIDKNTFEDCTALTSITLPQSVQSIGNSAFAGCTNLATVTLPTSMPNGTLGESAFWKTALRNIVIPSGIKTIPSNCFQGCQQLASVTLPEEGLEEIQFAAFSSCSQLSAITIPASVNLVGYGAFNTDGMSIQFLGTLPAKDGGNAFTTTAVPGYLVLNNTMCTSLHNLLLPNVRKASLAATYNIGIDATVYYNYTGTDTDSPTDLTKYTQYIPKENSGDDFGGGNDWTFE